jgi:hypothetical protein
VKKIESLTEEQRARFSEWVEKWKAIGLSCEPADWDRAERGILAHYAAAKLPPPKKIVRVGSPLVCVLAGPIAAVLTANAVHEAVYGAVGRAVDRAVDGAVGEAVRGAVYGAVGRAVHGAVRGEVYEAVDGAVHGEVGVAVDREVYGAVKGAVDRAVDGAVGEAIREAISRLWNYYNGGSWWCNYPAYATFFRDVLGCDIPIGPREDTDTSCGWWWPHKEFCIVSDRPSKIRMDDRGRLHSASGPAIEWRDGWSLSFWHGQNVPHEWITHPEKLDPELALNHENAEMRRCVAEILGWKRVLERLDTKVIDTDRDPEIGQLLEVELHGNLKVRCGTGREFVLPVPPEMTRALEANAWTYGLNPGDLQLEART